jgi:acetyl-CoA carboxylase beta subunit
MSVIKPTLMGWAQVSPAGVGTAVGASVVATVGAFVGGSVGAVVGAAVGWAQAARTMDMIINTLTMAKNFFICLSSFGLLISFD